jgi:hypothetical protein
MGYPIKQGQTAQPLAFLMVDSVDHITGKTGLSPTVTLSKNGAAFGAPAGAVSEIGNGWYKIAGNATDADTLGPLLLHATATGADPTDDRFDVVAYDPQSATNLGLTALPGATAGANGGLFLSGANAGPVAISTNSGNALTLTSSAAAGSGLALSGGSFGKGLAATGGVAGIAADFLGNITGSLSGSVGSVLGDLIGRILGGGSSAFTGVGAQSDLQTIKTQAVTAAAPVTFPAAIGTSTYAGGAVASVTAPVTAGTVTDKAGYSLAAGGLDAISVADPGGVAGMTTIPKMIVALWRRFYRKTTLTSTQLKTYADDGTTVNTTQTAVDDSMTQTQGPAT